GAGGTSAAMNRLQDHRSGAHRLAAAAIFFGDQNRQIAGACQRLHKGRGIAARRRLVLELAPIAAGKRLTQLCDAFPVFRIILANGKRRNFAHAVAPALSTTTTPNRTNARFRCRQRPLNRGGRRSLKAQTPSSRSSVPTRRL